MVHLIKSQATPNTKSDESNIATGSISVDSSNSQPVADYANVSTEPSQSVGILLAGSDNQDELGSLTFYIASLPQHGALSDSDPADIRSLAYAPDDGFTGTDSFTFVIYDSAEARSNIGTVEIEVSAPAP